MFCETELDARTADLCPRHRSISADSLLTIINDILDFSKIEAGKLQLDCAGVAIDDCVQGVVELLAPQAYEKGLDIGLGRRPEVPRHLLGDEVRLRQISPTWSATPSSSPMRAAC